MIALTSIEGLLRICVLRGDLTTVRLEGELDFASVDVVEAAACLVPDGATVVTFDLSDLSFIDGAGAEALAALHAAQVIRGRTVRLTGARPRIRRIFGILGMGSLLSATQSQRSSTPARQRPRPEWLRTKPLALRPRSG